MKRHVLTLSLLLSLLAPISASAATLQCQYLPQLFEVYFRNHYSVKSLTPEVRAHTVEQLIKNMDPSKTLFLDSDVTQLKTDLPKLFDTMKTGDCGGLDKANALMVKRAKENEDFVRKFLDKNYKLDESVEIQLDPDKRGFAKDDAARKEALKKFVHFQISSLLQTEIKLPEAKRQLVHRYELITKRMTERKTGDMVNDYAEAFALALDPHSSYLSKDSLDDFQIQMRLTLEGIGASLTSQDGFTVIEDTIPGGGAEKSKMLRPKDKIIAVAQEGQKPVSVIDMDLKEVVKLIRGKKGTKVTLTILRQAEKTETFTVTIVRDKIDIKEQAAKITYQTRKVGDKTYKIGVIDLPSFYGGGGKGERSCFTDMRDLLEQANKQKVDGIVLDLSRNGGGLLDSAVKITGLFLKKGGVVATKDAEGKVEVLSDDDEDTLYPGPLLILTSRLSASASEILAGALKDYKRALIVGGDHTFGKGTVQFVSDLPLDLGAMKVTTGMFFPAGGKSTQWSGVPSDILLPSVFNNEEVGEKKLDYSLPPQAIPSFVSSDADDKEAAKHWKPVDESLVKKLAALSKERVDKDPKFAEIKKNIEDAAKNKNVVKLADLRKKNEAEEKKHPKRKDESPEKKDKELEAPFLQEGVNIMADMIANS